MSALMTSTLRPGLLVGLKTSISGNVRYQTTELEAAHFTGEGFQKSRWETEKQVTDPVEHEAAKAARSAARNKVAAICANSAFGLLCPQSRESELERAIAEAQEIAAAFNATARYTRVSVYAITGRIADDDVEAVRAINSEVRSLLDRMEDGVRNLDAAEIRKAAFAARSIGAMLSSSAVQRVAVAITAARDAAKAIVKAGETAAITVDQAALKKIAESRMAFLDLDEAQEVAAPVAAGRALDFEPDAPAWEQEVKAFGRALEIAYPLGYSSGDTEA